MQRRAVLLSGLALPLMARAAGFDARAAWASFSQLLQQRYAYFERAGVDGPALLTHFEPLALACADEAALAAVLQALCANFADPHLGLRPLRADSFSVVPTMSDLAAELDGERLRLADVRHDSAAQRAGLRPGDRVLDIAGLSPQAAVQAVLARPWAEASLPQRVHALNLALAGRLGRPRRLRLAGPTPAGQTLELAPTREQADRVRAGPRLTVERQPLLGLLRIQNALGEQALVAEFREALSGLLELPALFIDLRNTPSGGNTTVARGLLGHFVREPRPYQMHTVPAEARAWGVERRFVEYVAPREPFYPGRVFVAAGRWTGSMGEGLVMGFDAIGARTVGSAMAGLLGGLSVDSLAGSGLRVEYGSEALFHVDGRPRADFRPALAVAPAERTARADPCLDAVREAISRAY